MDTVEKYGHRVLLYEAIFLSLVVFTQTPGERKPSPGPEGQVASVPPKSAESPNQPASTKTRKKVIARIAGSEQEQGWEIFSSILEPLTLKMITTKPGHD